MTTLEDDVRAAVHRRAEAHEVVVPPLDELVRAPYADGPARSPRRRALAGVAAAVLVVALGAAAAVLVRDDRGERPTPAIQPPPVAGTHGALLTGFGPPVDGSELLFEWTPTAVDGTLVVLRERDGDGTAVVAFAPDTGTSSFDVLPLEGGTAVEVGGHPAVRYPPTHVHPGLPVLEVDRGGDQRLFVAGVDLDDTALVPLAEAALAAGDPGAAWWPADRYEATYTGPDANPFAAQRGDERTLGYEVGGVAATVGFDVDITADPADYAWFLPGSSVVEEPGGRRVVRWYGGRGATAAWSEAGGLVVVHAAAVHLDEVEAAVRVVDRASWDAERARATAPGSRFGSDTTEAVPGTTG